MRPVAVIEVYPRNIHTKWAIIENVHIIFLAGCYIFFLEGIKGIAQTFGFDGSVNLFIFTVLIGGNFIFEVLFNIILCPTIIRIVDIGKKS